MKDIHTLINELGARLNDEDRDEARIILNYLYLDGYDDLFICIALIKVLERGDFKRNKYLFSYQPFLNEINDLKNKFKNISSFGKDIHINAVYHSIGDTINDFDRAIINEYFELPFESKEDEVIVNNYADYLYMKYSFSYSEILDCKLNIYKKIVLGNNEWGARGF